MEYRDPGVLADLRARGLRRRVRPLESAPDTWVELDGRRLLHLCSNNYLGLATHPEVIAAATAALRRFGTGAGASRLVTGSTILHQELERELAELKGADDAVVFATGYLANLGVFTALAGPRDHVFADALNHASLFDGARTTHAALHVYRHADLEHLEHLLAAASARGRRMIVTDGVFSMEGDLAPLPDLAALANRYEALLIVDDAHGTGVLGPRGAGAVAHFGLDPRQVIQVGTLSKALAAQGGVVAGSNDLIDLLRHRARSFIYSTGLAPSSTGAALSALRIARDSEGLRDALRANTAFLRGALARLGTTPQGDPVTPITSLVLGDPDVALNVSRSLEEEGVLITAIRPPTVPDGTSRLRVTAMATHTPGDLEHAVHAFSTTLAGMAPGPADATVAAGRIGA